MEQLPRPCSHDEQEMPGVNRKSESEKSKYIPDHCSRGDVLWCLDTSQLWTSPHVPAHMMSKRRQEWTERAIIGLFVNSRQTSDCHKREVQVGTGELTPKTSHPEEGPGQHNRGLNSPSAGEENPILNKIVRHYIQSWKNMKSKRLSIGKIPQHKMHINLYAWQFLIWKEVRGMT